MTEIHNMQVILSQIPRAQKLNEHTQQLIPNGNQILNVVAEVQRKEAMTKTKELTESERTEREEPEKRRIKKDAKQKNPHKLDLWG